MSEYAVVPPEQGDSHWQPEPARGYITVKASPQSLPGIPFSQGIQCLPPGAHVRPHSHERQYEVILTLEGNGIARVGGREFPMTAGTVISVAPKVEHSFHNNAGKELRFLWTISPPGLEDFFAMIGRPRQRGEPEPAPFVRPSDSAIDTTHDVRA